VQSFKQRIYPNQAQRVWLRQAFGCSRFVYNWALGLRSEAWSKDQIKITGPEIGKKLTQLKKQEEFSWLKVASARSLFYTLMNLEVAYSKFFNKKAAYPKFKKRKACGGSAKFDDSQYALVNGKLRLPKLAGTIRVNWTRPLPCDPKFVTVSQDACGDFWASFTCDHPPTPLPPVSAEVAIDLGIETFATLSTGEKLKAPDIRRKRQRVEILQRRAAKKQKGSANRRKALIRVARAHRKVSNTRKDFLHKLSTRLIRENQTVILEDLAVKNMVKNHSLARAISEQGWAEFVTMLEYKAEWYGRGVVKVDRFFPSSKTCSACAFIVERLPLNIRSWECPRCGVTHDRDVNAAKNILAAGRAVTACGDSVRPEPVSGKGKGLRSRKTR
jgi:putative transposase